MGTRGGSRYVFRQPHTGSPDASHSLVDDAKISVESMDIHLICIHMELCGGFRIDFELGLRQNFENPHLVGGLEHFLFSHILGMSSSQLTNSYVSEG